MKPEQTHRKYSRRGEKKETHLTDLVWPIEEVEKSNNVIVYILAKWIASVLQQETNTKRHRRDKAKQHKENKNLLSKRK